MISFFRAFAILTNVLLTGSPSAWAWGAKGHKIAAMIAVDRLSPAARQQVKLLLAGAPDGRTLPAVSVWADIVRKRSRPETERWHFVDIPVGKRPTTFDRGRDCRLDPRRGDCIIAAIERELRTLADGRAAAAKRREALKFLTHLVADLHQPLHCAEREHDRGGNDVDVVLMGDGGWNLHAVWDSGLLAHGGRSQSHYVKKLSHWLQTQDADRMAAGTPVDWANEAHALALSHVYRTPNGRSVLNRAKLDRRYVDAGLAVVEQQLARAGVRLAAVLNTALR